MARADEGKAADRIGGKSGALDQPRAQRVMRDRQQQRLAAREQLRPGRASLHLRCCHSSLLATSRCGWRRSPRTLCLRTYVIAAAGLLCFTFNAAISASSASTVTLDDLLPVLVPTM